MILSLRLIVSSILLFLISTTINAASLHGKICNTIETDIKYCLFKEQTLPFSRSSNVGTLFNDKDLMYRGVPIVIKLLKKERNYSKKINIKIRPVGNASAYYYIVKRSKGVEKVSGESHYISTLSKTNPNVRIYVLSDSTLSDKASLEIEINGQTERINFITHKDSNYCRLDVLTYNGELHFNSQSGHIRKGRASFSYQSDTKKKLKFSFLDIKGPQAFSSNSAMATKLNDSFKLFSVIKQQIIIGPPSSMKIFPEKTISKDATINIIGAGRILFKPYFTGSPKNLPAGDYTMDVVVECQ